MSYLTPPPAPQPVIVFKDVGGLVTDYQARTEEYRRENREVRLHECRSACTLALSLPNVCVYPDAQVKFHQAYNANTHEADLGVSAQLWDSYPAPVRARLGTLTRQYKVLSGYELIALGMRNCAQGDRIMVAKRQPPPRAAAPAPVPAADPLGQMAQNMRVALARALASPEGQATATVTVPDRSHVAALARLGPQETLGAAFEAPLPPRRPDFAAAPVVALAPPAESPAFTVIAGASPILDPTRFAAVAYAPRIDAQKSEEGAREEDAHGG